MEEIALKKIVTCILLFSLCLAMLPGCSTSEPAASAAPEASLEAAAPASESSPAASAAESKPLSEMTFAYCASSTNDYWTVLQSGVIEASKEQGINITTALAAEGDVAAGVQLVENAISAGVDGIITAASDPNAFIDVINRAVEAGIIVVTVDQDAPTSNRQYFVGTSNYEAGVIAGQKMIEVTGGKANIAIFAGTITASNAVDRIKGFTDAIKDSPDMVVITHEEVKNDVQITMQKTEAVFNGYPEVNAIYGVFAYDPLGAAKTVKEMGRTGEVTVIGFDDLEESVQLLKEGVISALLVQQPYEIGRLAVETCVQAAQGNGPAPGNIDADILVVDASNVNELYK